MEIRMSLFLFMNSLSFFSSFLSSSGSIVRSCYRATSMDCLLDILLLPFDPCFSNLFWPSCHRILLDSGSAGIFWKRTGAFGTFDPSSNSKTAFLIFFFFTFGFLGFSIIRGGGHSGGTTISFSSKIGGGGMFLNFSSSLSGKGGTTGLSSSSDSEELS